MTFHQFCMRTATVSVAVVLSCCANASGLFGQEVKNSGLSFRDANLLSVLADAEEGASERPAQENKIRQTSAVQRQARSKSTAQTRASVANAANSAKKRGATKATAKSKTASARRDAVRQTQYERAETAPLTAQGLTGFDLTAPFTDACPDPRDMPPIREIPYKLIPTPGPFPEGCPLPDEEFRRKAPTPITFTWKASSLCYKPLYFEDVQLERYGHYCRPCLQPFVSRAKFLLTIPCLPYLMGVNPPNECVYDLGYYRPGNCAPSMLQPIPISLRGGLLEAGAIVGLGAIIP